MRLIAFSSHGPGDSALELGLCGYISYDHVNVDVFPERLSPVTLMPEDVIRLQKTMVPCGFFCTAFKRGQRSNSYAAECPPPET